MDFSVGQERLHLGGKMLDNQAIHSAPLGHDGVHLKGKYPKGWWFCYQHFTPLEQPSLQSVIVSKKQLRHNFEEV